MTTNELLIQAGLAAISCHNATLGVRDAVSDLYQAEERWCIGRECGMEYRMLLPDDQYAEMRRDCAAYHDAVRKAKRAQYNAKRRLGAASRRVSHLAF